VGDFIPQRDAQLGAGLSCVGSGGSYAV